MTAASVSAGTYVLSEAGPAGYTASAWSCTGGGTLTGSSLVLTPGVSATCTIENDDQPATLTLEKTVINDDGGTAVATDWTLGADGPTPIEGVMGDPAVTGAAVDAGTYVLSEAGPAGYTASAWECDAGTLTGSSLVLTPGVSATCTIENDDQPASLTLVKTVINDNGGTAVATDWALTATGPTSITGATGTAPVTGAAVDAGTYVLSEAGPAGYSAGAWECDAGTLTGASLVLTPGVSATCTIENDDQPATLTLEKTVDNGTTGTAVATDWTLSATGPVTISGPSGDPAVTAAPVEVGAYALAESGGPAGYTASDWTCTAAVGEEEPPAALDVVDGSVSLTEGLVATCTIVNTAVPPTPPTTAPPTTAVPPTTAPASGQAAPPVCPAVITPLQSAEDDCPPLPFTGLEVARFAAVAAALIGVGAAFVAVRRRRRAHAQG